MSEQRELLDAVLDRLLPAVDELPGAGELGIGAAIATDPLSARRPGDVATVLGRLPGGFRALPGAERDAALAEAERALPDAFATLINLAYNAYYLDPRVLARVERVSGYRARAPQPAGYALEPLDERLLAPVRGRAALWRADPREPAQPAPPGAGDDPKEPR